MKWFIANWIQISYSLIQNLTNTQLSHMIHREAFHIIFLQIYPFIRVDLPYTNIYNIFKWDKVLKPIKSWEAACETGSMCYRVSMIITIWTLKGINEIRVSINPNNLQIFIVRIKSVKSGCAYWMITSNSNNNFFTLYICKCLNNFIIDLSKKII